MKKEFLQSIKVISLGLVLAFGINFAMAAWSGPTSAPTGGNVDGPITTSDNDKTGNKNQIKYGGVNFGKGVSIGKATDPQTYSTLDVDGVTYTKGIANLGVVGIYPSGFNKGPDGQLLEVFGSYSSFDDPVFAVDTTQSNPTTITKNLYVKEMGIFDDLATFNSNVSISGNEMVEGRISVGTLSGTYPGSNNEYNLNLKGTTNIGRNDNYCVLSKNDVESRQRTCPVGLYLAGLDVTADESINESYATCRPFDPQIAFTNNKGDTCYTKPPLSSAWRLHGGNGFIGDGSAVYTNGQAAKCVKQLDYYVAISGGEFTGGIKSLGGTIPTNSYSNGLDSTITWWFAEGSADSNNWHEDTSCRGKDFCRHKATSSVKKTGYMQRARFIVKDSNSLQSTVENALWMQKDNKCA